MLYKKYSGLTLLTSLSTSPEHDPFKPQFFFLAENSLDILTPPQLKSVDKAFDMCLGLLLRHGRLTFLFKCFSNLKLHDNVVQIVNTDSTKTLGFLFKWLWADLSVSYQVKYCRLNRKIRKIVKNKYKYQKRYEWIPPRLRAKVATRFFKNMVLTEQSLFFYERLQNTINAHLENPETSHLKQMVQQTQASAVSVLAQTKVKV